MFIVATRTACRPEIVKRCVNLHVALVDISISRDFAELSWPVVRQLGVSFGLSDSFDMRRMIRSVPVQVC